MILKACAIAIIGAFVALVLRELGVRAAPVFCAVCGAVIISPGAELIGELAAEFGKLAAVGGLSEVCADILKIVGVGYIFGFCSDVCTDVGEPRIASALTFIGRLEIIGITMPYFIKIINAGIAMIK